MSPFIYKKYYGDRATRMTQELQEMGKAGRVNIQLRPIRRSDFDNAYMVIAASPYWKLNEQICKVCKEEGIYVNVSGDKEESDFYFPGLCIADDSVIGIQTGSTDTARKRELREETDQVLTRLTKKWKAADE